MADALVEDALGDDDLLQSELAELEDLDIEGLEEAASALEDASSLEETEMVTAVAPKDRARAASETVRRSTPGSVSPEDHG